MSDGKDIGLCATCANRCMTPVGPACGKSLVVPSLLSMVKTCPEYNPAPDLTPGECADARIAELEDQLAAHELRWEEIERLRLELAWSFSGPMVRQFCNAYGVGQIRGETAIETVDAFSAKLRERKT